MSRYRYLTMASVALLALIVSSSCKRRVPAASTPPVVAPAPPEESRPAPVPQPAPAPEPKPQPTQPPPATTPAASATFAERLEREVRDIYFDYDKYSIRPDAQATLEANATALSSILAAFPGAIIAIEGYCDERGSAEYNLGLGDRRAQATLDFLKQLGLPAERFRIVSYGRERPQCLEDTGGCHARNRRAHFTPDNT